jgi:hypothetical protein
MGYYKPKTNSTTENKTSGKTPIKPNQKKTGIVAVNAAVKKAAADAETKVKDKVAGIREDVADAMAEEPK